MILLALSGTLFANEGNIPPVAVLTEDPDRTWFYNAEEVIFSGASSTDVDGTVNYYRFYVNGSLKYQGSSSNYSTCFVLNGSANSGCYELGSGATTVSIKLGARDNSGEWDYQTISYTIQEHKGRKYFITDHLGSVRATINRDGNVLGYDDYYPFGLSMPGRSANTANPNDLYKFTGHERDEEAGLTLDYMNARNYDPITGRFLQIDPLVDQFPSLNPYHYVYNNPLGFTDPTGMAPMGYGMNNEQNYSGVNVMNGKDLGSTHTDEEGNVVAVYDDGDTGVYSHTGSASEIQTKTEACNTSGDTSCGGTNQGETYTIDALEVGDIVKFGSDEATELFLTALYKHISVNDELNDPLMASVFALTEYMSNAGNTGSYDIKHGRDPITATMLFGKYVTYRQAGNMLAGFVAAHNGLSFDATMKGFGAFQMSGNRIGLNMVTNFIFNPGAPNYGERPKSSQYQQIGYRLRKGF